MSEVTETRERPQLTADRPAKELPCVHPGCIHKFRMSTQYSDFLAHYRQKHSEKKIDVG